MLQEFNAATTALELEIELMVEKSKTDSDFLKVNSNMEDNIVFNFPSSDEKGLIQILFVKSDAYRFQAASYSLLGTSNVLNLYDIKTELRTELLELAKTKMLSKLNSMFS